MESWAQQKLANLLRHRVSCVVASCSRQDLLHHLAFHIGEAEIAATVAIREPFVVEAEEVQHGGVEVVDVDLAIDALGAVVIAFAVTVAGLHATAGHPNREGAVVMVPTVTLGRRGAAELGAKDDECVIEKAALPQIGEQAGDGLVRGGAAGGQEVFDVVVMIPSAGSDLDVANTGLGELACEEALAAKAVRGRLADAVELAGLGGFLAHIEQRGHCRLHAEGHLVGCDDALELRVHLIDPETALVDLSQQVELRPLLRGAEMRGNKVGHGQLPRRVIRRSGADHGGLAGGGQEGAAVVVAAEGVQGVHGDVTGQVLGLGAKAINAPGSGGGSRLGGDARVEERHGGLVRLLVGVHGVEHTELVRVLRDVGIEFADPVPALAVLGGLPHAAHELGRAFRAKRLAGIRGQLWLVIKGVHMRDAALHEDHDDALGSGGEMR